MRRLRQTHQASRVPRSDDLRGVRGGEGEPDAFSGLFAGFVEKPMRATTTCLITHDRNKYSIDARAAWGRSVLVRVYADRIIVLLDDEMVADHPRRFGDQAGSVCGCWRLEGDVAVRMWRAMDDASPVMSGRHSAIHGESRRRAPAGLVLAICPWPRPAQRLHPWRWLGYRRGEPPSVGRHRRRTSQKNSLRTATGVLCKRARSAERPRTG